MPHILVEMSGGVHWSNEGIREGMCVVSKLLEVSLTREPGVFMMKHDSHEFA